MVLAWALGLAAVTVACRGGAAWANEAQRAGTKSCVVCVASGCTAAIVEAARPDVREAVRHLLGSATWEYNGKMFVAPPDSWEEALNGAGEENKLLAPARTPPRPRSPPQLL